MTDEKMSRSEVSQAHARPEVEDVAVQMKIKAKADYL
jgi:hypothetical protein